jgi:hypothetical protein
MPQGEEPLILALSKPGVSLCLPEWAEVLPSQGRGVVDSWQIMFEPMIGNAFIYDVAAFMYVILSKAEKHVPCEELICTTEYLTLQTSCRIDRCSNKV